MNAERAYATLHIIYVIHGYRRLGVEKLLLTHYESLLLRAGCPQSIVVPITTRSLKMFRQRNDSGGFAYDAREPRSDELRHGNETITDD